MWTRTDLDEIRAILDRCIADADAELIDAIRRNDARHGSRDDLLAQLDLIDKVKERLHVRFERFRSGEQQL